MQAFEYKTTESGSLSLDMYFSNGAERKGMFVFLHGGALLLGSRKDLPQEVVSYLNERGWDVASADYRLAPENSLSDISGDVSSCCRFLREKYPDTTLVLAGYSAGAYLALLNGAIGAPVDGILAFAGYGDLSADWYFTPSEFFREYKNVDYVKDKITSGVSFDTTEELIDLYVYLRQTGTWPEYIFGDKLDSEILKFSPIAHLPETYPPTVLVHGDGDTDVPVSASIKMAEALAKRKLPHKLFVLKDKGHDVFAEIDDDVVSTIWDEALTFLSR